MTEKRQGISARWEESGKGGAVFLPLPTLPLSKAGVGVCIVYIPRYSATLMFWARPNGLGFAFGELLGKAPQVTKGACSWLGPSFLRVPSLRRRSVGPRRTGIHALTALSRHPCRSAHCASSAFSLHPSRVLRCLSFLRTKINSFPAEAGPTNTPRAVSDDRSLAPRGNAAPDAPRPADDAHSGRGSDAERHGMHTHAERGNDQISLTRRARRRTGFSREAFDLLLICF